MSRVRVREEEKKKKKNGSGGWRDQARNGQEEGNRVFRVGCGVQVWVIS